MIITDEWDGCSVLKERFLEQQALKGTSYKALEVCREEVKSTREFYIMKEECILTHINILVPGCPTSPSSLFCKFFVMKFLCYYRRDGIYR